MLRRPEVRLLTLTGPPGTGKTRLGVQVAAHLLHDFAEGVYFVPLAPINDPGLVASAIAKALEVKEVGSRPLIEGLSLHLRGRQLLLLLDNFEHLIKGAPVVSELLATASQVKIVATSRELLHLSGEHDFPVPPLSLPPLLVADTSTRILSPVPPEYLGEYEAVQLFMQRAVALKPDFALTESNAPDVAEICRRLDGLPLAIELAAARIRHLSPLAMLDRLRSRLNLLTGGAQDLPARQRTLRAAIEWSYDLLGEQEQKLFRRLAVFRGGRTLEAIEAVCKRNADGDTSAGSVQALGVVALDGVGSLIDKNLLNQQAKAGGEPRYIMLETIHEYAREKLEDSGEAEAMQSSHANFFLELAESAEPELRGPRQTEWLDRLEAEHDNFRAVLEWAYHNDIRLGLRLAAALGTFWNRRGYLSEGEEWTLEMLSRAREAGVGKSGSGAASMAGALYAAGFLFAMRRGDFVSAHPLLDESVKIYKELQDIRLPLGREDRRGLVESLNILGIVMGRLDGMPARRRLHEEALKAAREIGDKWSVARSLYQLGHVGRMSGDYSQAHSMFEESLSLFRELGDKFNIGLALIGVGMMVERQRDHQSARRLYEESLFIYRELGDKWGISGSLYCLGGAALYRGDYASAGSILEENLAVAKELGSPGVVAETLENLGRAAYFLGDYARAHLLYKESLARFREVGDKYGSALCLADLAGVIAVAEMTTRKATERRSKGQSKAEGTAPALAVQAVQSLGAAQALFDSIGVQLDPVGQELFNSYIAACMTQLNEQTFGMAWADGRAMEFEQALAWAQNTPIPRQVDTDRQALSSSRAMKWALGGLTSREREVATLIAQGKSNREIADELVVSERTVEGHVSNILSKLGFQSRSQISAWVVKQNLTRRPK